MFGFELLCLAIVALYSVMRGWNDPHRGRLALRLASVGLAGGIGEHFCIELYGFYEYSPEWTLFFGHVPVMVMVIWPFVIHSGWEIASRLGTRPLALGFFIVLADASLIEPIAVRAGLWWWSEPGLFGVPPIGVLGWALFGLAAMATWRWAEDRAWWSELVVIPAAVTFAHLALIATWWGALRWMSAEVPPVAALALAWVAALVAAWAASRAPRLPRVVMLLRVPPALLFGGLLVRYGPGTPELIAWALAFVPAYVLLTARCSSTDPDRSAEADTLPARR